MAHQQIPESAETAAFVGIRDQVALAEDLFEQLALAALPGRDLFARAAVERAEILVEGAKIGQQLTRSGRHVQEAFAHLGRFHQFQVAFADPGDVGIDVGLALLKFGDAGTRIQLGAVDDLLEQVEYAHQARFRADEMPLAEAVQPFQGQFGRRSQVVMGFVLPLRIIFAQPAAFVGSPVVQVTGGGFWKQVFAAGFMQLEQVVVELGHQLLARDRPGIRRDEAAVQETCDHRRVVRGQQSPGGMRTALREKLLVIHHVGTGREY
jgi:hypothetical protein